MNTMLAAKEDLPRQHHLHDLQPQQSGEVPAGESDVIINGILWAKDRKGSHCLS